VSAYDEECGCGEYTCLRCFQNGPPENAGPFGNWWLDEAWREKQKLASGVSPSQEAGKP
jgi:hypothetical protein